MFKLVFMSLVVFLIGCSNVPKTIRQAPLQDIQIQDTAKDFSKHQFKTVRWGGTLIDVKNTENETTFQVLAFPLYYTGRPNLNEPALGRFIVKSNVFLDPAIYINRSELTVSGRLTDEKNIKVDQKGLKLPVIELHQIYLWPKYRSSDCGNSPYFSGYKYVGYGYRR